MSRGIDCNVDAGPRAKCLYDAGYRFAARYMKSAGHPLTVQEAKALSDAGLSVVSICERGYPTEPAYFSHARGKEDGHWAHLYAQGLSQPRGAPIFYAVDFDASQVDVQNSIAPYFKGIQEAFDAADGGESRYPIGVYGSGLVCQWLLRHTAVTYAWLAMSRGWRASRTFTGWNIRQLTSETVCGMRVDTDESNGFGGGWKL